MSDRAAYRVIRAPGTLYVNVSGPYEPSLAPFGGVALGNTQGVYIANFGTGFTVWSEEYGEPADQLEVLRDAAMGCFLRSWDDDAISAVFPNTSEGVTTQHQILTLHGSREPGESIYDDRATTMIFLPHNPKDAPAVLAYAAVPLVDESSQLRFSYGDDLGIPALWRFFRDGTGKIAEVGRAWDLGV